MVENVYIWVRNLAVFYIILTVVMQILPDNSYKENIRFFMGILLLLIILSPLLEVLNLQDTLKEYFMEKSRQEEYLESQWGDFSIEGQENIQEEYLQENYEKEKQRLEEVEAEDGAGENDTSENVEGNQ